MPDNAASTGPAHTHNTVRQRLSDEIVAALHLKRN
jgi:hypothetical protein